MRIIQLLIFTFNGFIFANTFAQTPWRVENDLLKTFKRIDYWRTHKNGGSVDVTDSLIKANEIFASRLKSYASRYPVTISYSFKSLLKELNISTSDDGLFRIYSWDTQTGGTMHFFENVMRYKSGKNTFAILDTPKGDGDARPNYHKIYTLKVERRSYYLGVYSAIGSTKDFADGIHIFTIENGKLNYVALFKTHSGLHSDLSYGYNFFSVVNIPAEKRPVIRFDNATSTIYLPLVDGNRSMTNKFILYKFTGQYFERIKN